MVNIRDLHEVQLDALREVANIGAGHAATALSQMMQSRIMVSVPQLRVAPLEEIPELLAEPDEVVAAVLIHMLGDLTGRTLLVFSHASALRLAERLLRQPAGSSEALGELEQSAVKETGNILCSAYMNALSDFMGMMLLPSVPSLAIDLSAAILTTAHTNFGREHDFVFSIQTQFLMDDEETVEGQFLLLPDTGSLQVILQSIRLA